MWLSQRLLKDRAVRGLPLAGVVTVAGATLVEVCVATTQVNFGAISRFFWQYFHKLLSSSIGNACPDHARCLLHFRQHEPVPRVILAE